MGLVDGTPLVTPAEVEEITHELDLANLNGTDATISNACKWATSEIMDALDARGIPPGKVANPERLKRAAAFFAAARALHGSRLGGDTDTRATEYLATARELVRDYRFVSSEPAVDGSNLTIPVVGNVPPPCE